MWIINEIAVRDRQGGVKPWHQSRVLFDSGRVALQHIWASRVCDGTEGQRGQSRMWFRERANKKNMKKEATLKFIFNQEVWRLVGSVAWRPIRSPADVPGERRGVSLMGCDWLPGPGGEDACWVGLLAFEKQPDFLVEAPQRAKPAREKCKRSQLGLLQRAPPPENTCCNSAATGCCLKPPWWPDGELQSRTLIARWRRRVWAAMPWRSSINRALIGYNGSATLLMAHSGKQLLLTALTHLSSQSTGLARRMNLCVCLLPRLCKNMRISDDLATGTRTGDYRFIKVISPLDAFWFGAFMGPCT